MDEHGVVYVLDKFGRAYRSEGPVDPDHPEAAQLEESPWAFVGPGRPLGFALDGQGNLVICNAPMVCPDTG